MKKNLLTVALLAAGLTAQAQLSYVGTGAKFYVSKGALVYNGGGMTIQGSGQVENHGNVMIVGTGTDTFRTVDASGNDKTEDTAEKDAPLVASNANLGGVFINKINEVGAYVNHNNTAAGDVYTYGQLYITGISQGNILGYVNEEHSNSNHGKFQQFAIPFYNKTASTLGTDLGTVFDNTRFQLNDITKWNNTNVVFDAFPVTTKTADPTAYYILGSKNLNFNNVKTVVGRPFADGTAATTAVSFSGGGSGVTSFGTNGNAINAYNERYNSYLQDGFQFQLDGAAWGPNYGRNMFMFGNPYLTNIDLRGLFNDPSDTTTGIHLSNIHGIRVEPAAGSAQYNINSGGSLTSPRYITWDATNNVPVGDVNWLIIRPLSVFSVKLKNSTAGSVNFDALRRFNYIPRTPTTANTVTAARSANSNAAKSNGTVKQLGVVALDASGNEIGRTYYVVNPEAVTGHSSDAFLQVGATSTNPLGTYEEERNEGGYDQSYTSKYWLYINEANEVDFEGKPIPMVLYNTSIAALKFEVRENAELLPNGQQNLSSEKSFYYQLPNGDITAIAQDQVIPVTVTADALEANLYYGLPKKQVVLAAANAETPSRTKVVYNPEIDNYVVIFDPNWKKANINVFDMSGKLVLSKNNVNASTDYKVELPKSNSVYIITAVSESGAKMSAKIIR